MGCGCCGSGSDNGKKIEDIEGLKTRVIEVLDEIRPMLQMDGGDIRLIDVLDTGDVHVQLTGACGNCPHATVTLKMGIERVLREKVPEVKQVIEVGSL